MSIGTSPDVGNLLKTTFYASTADSLTTHFIEETSEGCSIKSVLPENLTEVLMRTTTFHSHRELQLMQVLWENRNSGGLW